MWTPLVLMCSMYVTTDCKTYGGPVFKEEAACFAGIKNVGLPYLVQEFPSHKIVDIKCVYWDVSDKVGI